MWIISGGTLMHEVRVISKKGIVVVIRGSTSDSKK